MLTVRSGLRPLTVAVMGPSAMPSKSSQKIAPSPQPAPTDGGLLGGGLLPGGTLPLPPCPAWPGSMAPVPPVPLGCIELPATPPPEGGGVIALPPAPPVGGGVVGVPLEPLSLPLFEVSIGTLPLL